MRRMILACSVLLVLSSGASAGKIYKWEDTQGNVHFGSQPPEGQEAEAVKPNISRPKPTEPAAQAQQPKIDSAQNKADEKVREEVAKQEAERKKFCEAARYNLAQLSNNPRIRMEVDGEVRRLTEDERQERIAAGKASIKENCN